MQSGKPLAPPWFACDDVGTCACGRYGRGGDHHTALPRQPHRAHLLPQRRLVERGGGHRGGVAGAAAARPVDVLKAGERVPQQLRTLPQRRCHAHSPGRAAGDDSRVCTCVFHGHDALLWCPALLLS